ncbi:MAG: hypothetical protein MI753_06250 [Hyphomicrobiales bacterium]|nr:hypothetical protein [Hyphomicrobiales bacterium]
MLSELIATGRFVDLVLILIVLEGIALLLIRRYRGKGPKLVDIAPTLVAGAFLFLALRFALTDSDPMVIAACLTGALLSHIADLARRFRN